MFIMVFRASIIIRMSSSRPVREKRVMDEATRQRRARKALESLERDNYHDDPHANLVMSKKALNLFQSGDTNKDNDGSSTPSSSSSSSKQRHRKSRTSEYYKQRFRKNFSSLVEEEAVSRPDPPNYISAVAPESNKPPRKLCKVCGFEAGYNCNVCGVLFCSIRCQETHLETRCLKWMA